MVDTFPEWYAAVVIDIARRRELSFDIGSNRRTAASELQGKRFVPWTDDLTIVSRWLLPLDASGLALDSPTL